MESRVAPFGAPEDKRRDIRVWVLSLASWFSYFVPVGDLLIRFWRNLRARLAQLAVSAKLGHAEETGTGANGPSAPGRR
jgi:hypothetical protein